MNHPAIQLVDFDAEGMGLLEADIERTRQERQWIHVLHERGMVVGATIGVPSHHGPVEPMEAPDLSFDRPQDCASEIRLATGVERVVVIDRTELAGIVRAAVADAVAGPDMSLAELRSMVDERFWSSPAVATDPAPPRSPWRELRAFLASQGDLIARIELDKKGGGTTSLHLQIMDGLIVSATSHDLESNLDDGLPRSTDREPDIHLRVAWDGFVAALGGPDILDGLAALIESTESAHGLDGYPERFRSFSRA